MSPTREILVLRRDQGESRETVSFLGREFELRILGIDDDLERAKAAILAADGTVAAIVLDGMPARLHLGSQIGPHKRGAHIAALAKHTVVVDGHGIRACLERWGVTLVEKREPGIVSGKRVLMLPGLNHAGIAHGLASRAKAVRYADPAVFFGLPRILGIGSDATLDRAAPSTLRGLENAPFEEIAHGPTRSRGSRTIARECRWAEVIAGDITAILRLAPDDLSKKTIVVGHASEAAAEELARRGASILITLLPPLRGDDGALALHSSAVLEGLLAALRGRPDLPPTEDTYLDLVGHLDWTPAIRYLKPEEAAVNRFAFVIHPLEVRFIHADPLFRWTRYLPDGLVERVAARFPPFFISRIKGGRSPVTGQRIEGYLYSLGATPRMMMSMGERATYSRLVKAAHMSERRGARIMGLGAFTSVVGDAGITVDRETGIAITSGNSLTVAATLEAAKRAVRLMGVEDLTQGRAMVIGATGSIGSVCSRLLAQAVRDVVLVSIEPERLVDLKRTILAETPGARVVVATRSHEMLPECDLVVTTTSAFGQRVIDISQCKPGAVICDVARPPDVGEAEAEVRPDVLVIESGEVIIPGEIDFGYDIGLPPGTSYACLAETALLAMEGRFESFTLGRQLDVDRVKEIYRLFKKHHFELAPLRSFEEVLTPAMLDEKRALARQLREDPELLARVRAAAAEKLATIPPRAKGVASKRKKGRAQHGAWLGPALAALGRRLSDERA